MLWPSGGLVLHSIYYIIWIIASSSVYLIVSYPFLSNRLYDLLYVVGPKVKGEGTMLLFFDQVTLVSGQTLWLSLKDSAYSQLSKRCPTVPRLRLASAVDYDYYCPSPHVGYFVQTNNYMPNHHSSKQDRKLNLSFLSHSRRNRVIISTDEDCISLKEIDPYLIGYKRLLTDSKKRLWWTSSRSHFSKMVFVADYGTSHQTH